MSAVGNMLKPADFTRFMGVFHNQNQEVIQLRKFTPPDDLIEDLRNTICRSARHKAAGTDRLHNEMFKVAPTLFAELLFQWWALIGRSAIYPAQWEVGVFTPLHKKGDTSLPINYRPLCMLSHARKLIESALAGRLLRKLKVVGREFGFQRGLSSTITLKDVDTIVKNGRNRVATLDLSKAYDRVDRNRLLKDCELHFEENLNSMVSACLQPLMVKTRGDVLET